MAEAQPITSRLRIFISYSRRDDAIADVLVEALTGRGFAVTIDRRDLPFGERFQAELADFIRQSDTVLWLVSEPSIRSKWVNWELDEVAKRNKRLVPVMVGDTPRDALPRQLGEIHILPAEGLFDPALHLDTLVSILETDRGWLKEASRLADRAHEWLNTTHSSALLLRGGALTSAERWKDLRPAKAPAPPVEVLDLILASRRAATRRQRWLLGGAVAAAIVATVVAWFANLERNVAVEQTARATKATGEAEKQTAEAKKQTAAAEKSRLETVEVRNDSQRTGSGLLSQAAKDVFERDPVQAMLLALEGLPDATTGKERPVVAETQLQLDRAIRSVREQRIIVDHGAQVEAAAFSPDGRLAVTASKDRTARVFDVASGRQVARLAHDGEVLSARFSPDGRLIATASTDGKAQLFEVATGKEMIKFEDGKVMASSVNFSPDSKLIATGWSDGTVRLFDIIAVKETRRLAQDLAHDQIVQDVVFSPNGKLLAINCGNAVDKGEVHVFAVPDGRQIVRIGSDTAVSVVAFSPDSKLLATASDDKVARVFELTSGKKIAGFSHDDTVHSVLFSPDGKLLATASNDKTARIFAMADSQEIARLPHDGAVWRTAFSLDGKLLATASWDSTARIFEVVGGRQIAVLAHDNQVKDVAFSPDGRLVLTASDDATVRLFSVAAADVQLPHGAVVHKAIFSPDGKLLATASADGTARLFDSANGREIAALSHGDEVPSVAFSADGKLLATASYDTAARLFDVTSRNKIAEFANDGRVFDVALSPDGKLLATACCEKSARVFDVASGQRVAEFEHEGPVRGVAFSPDGKLLATAAGGKANPSGEVRLFDVATLKNVVRLPHDFPATDVTFSRDGRLLASSSLSSASVFEVSAGKDVTRIDVIGDSSIQSIALNPDATLIATAGGSADNTSVFLSDVASGKMIAEMAHSDWVNSAAFSPDGLTVATASQDRIARLWRVFRSAQDLVNAAKDRATRCLTQAQRKQYFLPPDPPQWCVERRLWPYHGDNWQAWLAAKKAGKDAPLPVN